MVKCFQNFPARTEDTVVSEVGLGKKLGNIIPREKSDELANEGSGTLTTNNVVEPQPAEHKERHIESERYNGKDIQTSFKTKNKSEQR